MGSGQGENSKMDARRGMIKQTRRKGFNLIEILIIFAIVVILAAIIYPVYTRYQDIKSGKIPGGSSSSVPGEPGRFNVHSVRKDGKMLYVVKDSKTGEEYIGMDNVPLVRVPRTSQD